MVTLTIHNLKIRDERVVQTQKEMDQKLSYLISESAVVGTNRHHLRVVADPKK